MTSAVNLATANAVGPEISWKGSRSRLKALTRLDDEEIESLRLPSPIFPHKCISVALAHTVTQDVYRHHRPLKLGICAMEDKVCSKSNQEIFRRLEADSHVEVVLFGDKMLLGKPVQEWPACDFLIAFYSDGFPLDKAISYTRLRSPVCYNDLLMQKLLFDRRLCNRVLNHVGVRTLKRLEVNRDGGPRASSRELVQHVYNRPPAVSLSEDENTLIVDGRTLHKPFVEKPVSAEDHNIYIYFPRTAQTGGGRRLFRKVGNKCSEYDPNLVVPRCITEKHTTRSYVYEPLLSADNGEDVKAYAVGPQYCYAVTRKSPAITGTVRRDLSGKEIRQATGVSKFEAEAASKISAAFGQSVCGFDIVRDQGKSYVIDVNGWTSVKHQPEFYGQCAQVLRQMLASRRPN
ncbi:hypothetical protein BDV25DRAFT_164487 [Aspergillus avenaceus]|uniref:Inositol hexakisphosphate and diphosphoinositol-pentakisphosphate kinase n=1 Tax=Aspergillus avenaceus TaxID=36643 RepID=A0A5N6TGL3_ASPAV|nr:hypothetical protein BDV25DRAFT_164487 [Aspergillus avenaceus]